MVGFKAVFLSGHWTLLFLGWRFPFFGNLDKLISAYTLSSELFNILIAVSKAFSVSEILFQVYINKKIQNIIQVIIKTRPLAILKEFQE